MDNAAAPSAVLVSDECGVTLHRNDGDAGEGKVIHMPRSSGATVRAGITSQRKTDLVLADGSVTARSHLRDIMETIIIIPQF